MEKLLEYSWPVLLIAFSVIVLVGILKLCGTFKKIQNKNVRKLMYYVCNIVLSFAISAIYFAIARIPFGAYIEFGFNQVGATTILYAAYENFGLRTLLQMFFSKLTVWFKKNPEAKFTRLAKSLGLDSASVLIQKIMADELAKQAEQEQAKKAE